MSAGDMSLPGRPWAAALGLGGALTNVTVLGRGRRRPAQKAAERAPGTGRPAAARLHPVSGDDCSGDVQAFRPVTRTKALTGHKETTLRQTVRLLIAEHGVPTSPGACPVGPEAWEVPRVPRWQCDSAWPGVTVYCEGGAWQTASVNGQAAEV